jgi:polygalacturonase
VVASNIVAQGTDRGIRIKSGRGRGGTLENIRFDNWVIDDTPNVAIEATNYYTRIPDNVTINRCGTAVSIEGLPEMPIEGLRLTDVVANVKEGLSTGLDLDGVQARTPKEGTPVVRLDRVKSASLRNSVAWQGTGVFLSLTLGMKGSSTAIAVST